MMAARRDGLAAAGICAAALGVYWLTMFPGLGGGGDSAKFQYLGSVLGTAHPPGYPLFVVVSWVFSHMPVGTPAFRINFMSACCGALTIATVFLILRRLRVHPAAAVPVALALAFDRFLWSKSLAAEVYSLNALLVAITVWCAVRWAERGRDRDLFLTAGMLGLSLGNHLTSAMLAPALALFVLVTRPSSVRVRTTVICVLLGCVGLLQYLFVLVRSLQGATYVEARATNLRELVDVMFASRYSADMFGYTWRQLLVDRIPDVGHLFVVDLGVVGVLLAAVGVGYAIRTRLTSVWLFLAALAGVVLLTANVDADEEGFVLPALVMAWLLAGLGAQAVWMLASRAGRAAAMVVAAAFLLLPAWQITRHYKINDHHRRTYEIRYYDALFDQLENRAAFVQEEYAQDQLLLYKLAGEHAARGRDVRLVAANAATLQRFARDGFAVYAFDNRRKEFDGLGFRFEPVTLGQGVDMSPMPLFRMTSWTTCTAVGNLGWQDVSAAVADARMTLRIDNYRPFESEAVLYFGGVSAVAAVPAVSDGPVRPFISTDMFRTADAAERARLVDALRRDGVTDVAQLLQQANVQRVRLRVNDDGQFSQVTFGTARPAPEVAIARVRVDLDNPRRAVVCGWPGRTLFGRTSHEVLETGGDGTAYFGKGWGVSGRIDTGEDIRWLADTSAELAVPLAAPADLRLRIRARPSPGPAVRAIGVTVNGRPLAIQPVAQEWQVHTWTIDREMVPLGLNQIRVDVIGASGVRGPIRPTEAGASIAVSDITLDQLTPAAIASAASGDR